MKTRIKFISALCIILVVSIALFTACQEEITGPDTVPIKAEIKQVIVNNSVYRIDNLDAIPEDIDTVMVTVPEGTDVTQLDLDILVSYFGSIEPLPGITNLTNPVTYTVTSNVETRQVMVMANVVPPSLTTFMLTSPVDVVGKISNDSIMLEVLDGIDLSAATFSAEFFGESVVPDPLGVIDLTVDNPTVKVVNGSFESTYKIIVEYYGAIEFTGFIYDCSVHPNDLIPGAVGDEDAGFFVVEDDNFAELGGKVNHFTSLLYDGNKSGSAKFSYADLGINAEPDEMTVIFRAKGIDTNTPDRYAEMSIHMGDWRFQFWVEDVKLDGTDIDQYKYEDDPNGLDPLEWNTYRITINKITNVVKVYVNENTDPIEALISALEPKSGKGYNISFGDGSGSNTYDGLFDYIIIETEGAYSPEDLPLSDILEE